MFIVGIDVAKRNHEVSIITSEGQTVHRAFSIRNNCTGYNHMMEKVKKLTNIKCQIVFAMESTAFLMMSDTSAMVFFSSKAMKLIAFPSINQGFCRGNPCRKTGNLKTAYLCSV